MIYVNRVVKYSKPKIIVETPKVEKVETPAPVSEKMPEQEKTESRRGRKSKDEK